jgi:hypothetical protein
MTAAVLALPLLLSVPLETAGAVEVAPIAVLALDLEHDPGLGDVARNLNSAIPALVDEHDRLAVTTEEGLREMVALEAKKEALGCDDDSSCLSELAGAMGARVVLFGRVGQLGDATIVSVGAFDATRSEEIGREQVQSQRLEELPRLLRGAARKLLDPWLAAERLPPLPKEPEAAGPSLLLVGGGVVAGAGALVAIGGTIGVALAELTLGDKAAPPAGPTAADKDEARGLGRVALGVAVAGLVVTAAGGGLLVVGLME